MDGQAVLDFLVLAGLLKTNKRTGWLLRGVANPESIADHQYRMALAAAVAWQGPAASASNPVLVALVHDIAEALVGDFAPHDNISKRDKRVLEAAAVRTLRASLGWSTQPALALQAAWIEYEHQTTPAGRFVKQLDKLEMCVQALEYEASWGAQRPSGGGARPVARSSDDSAPEGGPLREFYDGVVGKLSSPLLQGCFAHLQQQRSEVLQDGSTAAARLPAPPHQEAARHTRARSTSRKASASSATAPPAPAPLPCGATDPREAFLPLDRSLLEELRGGALLQPDIVLGFGGDWTPAYRELVRGALRRAEDRKRTAEQAELQKAQCHSTVRGENSSKGASQLVDWGARGHKADVEEVLLLACGVLVCFALLQYLLD